MGSGASKSSQVVRVYKNASIQTDTDIVPLLADEVTASSSKKNVPATVEDTWLAVCETLDVPKGQKSPHENLVVKRTGWKTIRIFVSSTFRDFMNEREILVKEVFPDLRAWCESRRLHLVDCDLRWGVPKDTTTELTLRTCLGEIDRCYQDNIMPYFLNMTSERIGWIPMPGEVPQNLVDEYRWIFGLSITEMEIVHGAYRKDNPNSIFLMRDDQFLNSVPPEHKEQFVDEQPVAASKIRMLKDMIDDRFPQHRVVTYKCEYAGVDPNTKKVLFNFDSAFRDKVFNFFKDRISAQYPMPDVDIDPYQKAAESHEAFMKSRSESVLGRKNILCQITDWYICGQAHGDVPMLLLGGPGSGKSSIMAKCIDDTITKNYDKKIPGGGKTGWHIFYHFVGAVPGSTDLELTLKRLLREIGAVDDSSMPADLDTTVQLTCGVLNNPKTPPVIVAIDALNQFDEDSHALNMTWLPKKLAPQVRCIFSMINDTPQHKNMRERESKPIELHMTPLSLSVRKDIISEMLGKYNKRLDLDQMITLLGKSSSENPLWLSFACEELRVFGSYRQLGDKINNLADGLLELLQQVLSRFEEENGGHLLVATLCLLEVSNTGLLESELLEILADEDKLIPPDKYAEKGMKEKSQEKFKRCGTLPAMKWSQVYRALRTFLRPFGDSGEGRLDFYHRSLSKAVRIKYLKATLDAEDTAETKSLKTWWHKKLADYFEQAENEDRRVEEYPHHLIYLKDTVRLESFLSRWSTFDRLYDKEFSSRMLSYWRHCGGTDRMQDCWNEQLQNLKNNSTITKEQLAHRYEQIARVLVQAGVYDPALELARVALDTENNELGSRPERMIEIYSLLSNVWDQKVKLHEFVERSQIPEEKEALKYNNLCIDLLKKMNTKYHTKMLGVQLMKQAFSLSSFHDCGGDEEMSPQAALKLGEEHIQQSLKIFTEMKLTGLLAEAHMTRAVLSRGSFNEQLKHYETAMDLCKQSYGEYHILTGRIYMNTGICYEDERDYQRAYDCFRNNHLVNKQVYGPDHVKAKRSKGILTEALYARIARQRGHSYDDE